MTALRQCYLICNICYINTTRETYASSVREARQLARDNCWTRLGRHDVCPACTQKTEK